VTAPLMIDRTAARSRRPRSDRVPLRGGYSLMLRVVAEMLRLSFFARVVVPDLLSSDRCHVDVR